MPQIPCRDNRTHSIQSCRDKSRLEGEREGFHVFTDTHTVLTSDAAHYHIDAEMIAYESEEEVFRKEWKEKIERDMG